MKRYLLIVLAFIAFGCTQNTEVAVNNEESNMDTNPLLTKFDTPFGVPPFEKIKVEHYVPAIKEGIRLQQESIKKITDNTEEPTFDNTITVLDNSGQVLSQASKILSNLTSAETNEELQKAETTVTPLIAENSDNVFLNEKLFARIKVIYDKKETLNLNTEQEKVLEKYYKKFVRGGANLNNEDKEKLKIINSELALLSINFGDNILAETNAFKLIIDNKEDLSGLPQSSIDAASATAEENGEKGKWMFTIQRPSLTPFLQFSDKRELREKMLMAYANKGDNNNDNDNKKILERMVKLRYEKAIILGYNNYAEYVLEENMAKKPETVYNLINDLMASALPIAKKERAMLQEIANAEGANFEIKAWDWWYYAAKLKKQKYDFDAELLRPYFKLENVRNGAFMLANKLYGITFTEIKDIPVYHKDVTAFEVKEEDGTHIGVLYMDFFPRAGKRAGAWMSDYRKQHYLNGKDVRPIITNVCNFTKPTADKPSLLTFGEVETLFHEFGHGLHGLLSNCTYLSLSGTSVPRDFVELPSQIMENWASEPEMLKLYAKHYETGEVIPNELVEKMANSSKFNQGFTTVEYLSAAILDIDWHSITDTNNIKAIDFENNSLKEMGLIDEIIVRYRSTYFAHIFAGGYATGYYGYVWAEILDADAFGAFKEKGIFNKELGQSFRDNIISKGGTVDAMEMYVNFRGREPKIEALLSRKGLN